MPRRTYHITVDGLPVEVIRKKIKRLNLSVRPPDGRVRISAPGWVNDATIQTAIRAKMDWIKRQQDKIAAQVEALPPAPRFVSGERHPYQGTYYELRVITRKGHPKAILHADQGRIDLYVRPGSDAATREHILQEWYRARLKAIIPPLVEKWERVTGLHVTEWRVKRMKTRWGTCNIDARRIWLNLELIKQPPQCLEYVIVHELVHLIERLHNQRFRSYMDGYMPRWRVYKQTLDKGPLGHKDWEY